MRKAYILSAIGASAIVGYMIKKKLDQGSEKGHTLLEDAGIPDQTEDHGETQSRNADMVSEGSLYGVKYYNEVREENVGGSIPS